MHIAKFLKRFAKYAIMILLASMMLHIDVGNKPLTTQEVWNSVFNIILFGGILAVLWNVGRLATSSLGSTLPADTVMYEGENIFSAHVLTLDQQKMLDETLPARALHEAAHAVAVYQRGHKVIEVSTIADMVNGRGGQCSWRLLDEENKPSLDHVIIALAGPIVEQAGYRQLQKNFEYDDYIDAQRDALQIAVHNPAQSPSEVLDDGMKQSHALVKQYRAMIEFLAQHLMHMNDDTKLEPVSLTGREVHELLEQFEQSEKNG